MCDINRIRNSIFFTIAIINAGGSNMFKKECNVECFDYILNNKFNLKSIFL